MRYRCTLRWTSLWWQPACVWNLATRSRLDCCFQLSRMINEEGFQFCFKGHSCKPHGASVFSPFLQEMNRPGEAIVHFQRAAELQTQTPIEALLSMGEIATCKILTRELRPLIRMRSCHLRYVGLDSRCLTLYSTPLICRWLWRCFISVHRDAADVSGERTAASRHHKPYWWGSDQSLLVTILRFSDSCIFLCCL